MLVLYIFTFFWIIVYFNGGLWGSLALVVVYYLMWKLFIKSFVADKVASKNRSFIKAIDEIAEKNFFHVVVVGILFTYSLGSKNEILTIESGQYVFQTLFFYFLAVGICSYNRSN